MTFADCGEHIERRTSGGMEGHVHAAFDRFFVDTAESGPLLFGLL